MSRKAIGGIAMSQLTVNEFEFLRKLISINSTGGDPMPGKPYGEGPYEALEFFLGQAEASGMRTGILDGRVGWCEIGPESSPELFGIVCHLDVVPGGDGWDTEPFELTFDGKRFKGRGIVDDKGPAAAAFFAMRRLMNSGFSLDCRVRLILGTDEERTCSCVEYYAEHGEIPTFAITPDAEYPVIYAEKGIMHIKVSGPASIVTAEGGSAANMVPASAWMTTGNGKKTAAGRTAHASRPELGVNAIFELCKKLSSEGFNFKKSPLLDFINSELVPCSSYEYTGCTIKDESGTVTANPSLLKCTRDLESLIIDVRCPISYKMEDITSHLDSLAKPYGLSCKTISSMAPICKEKSAKEIKILTDIWKENMSKYYGFEESFLEKYSEPLAIGGGTYARHIPNTIAFGLQAPWQEDVCHQANESRRLSDFEADIDVLTEAIKRLSGAI